MKGIILAGGRGTRLYPLTIGVSKQLLPVYDKPMIYYPLTILMLAGIREILIISTPDDLPQFYRLLGDGRQWGLNFSYAEQPTPRGLADAFIIGRKFIGNDMVCLILGDNIFFGHNLSNHLQQATQLKAGALIFAFPVRNPREYGVVQFNQQGQVVSLEEKPEQPRSKYAVPGLYFYDNQVVNFASALNASERGELEITDINRIYLERNQLVVKQLGRGVAWMDAGTHEMLLQASNFIQAVEDRQGLIIGCPEEIAYRMGFISREQLLEQAQPLLRNGYGEYLKDLADEIN